jgi:small-conductance mechanosensitive channel
MDQVRELWEYHGVRAAAIAGGGIIAAYVIQWVFAHTVIAFTRKTETDLDDQIVAALKRPVFLSAILIALAIASQQLPELDDGRYLLYATLKTLAILTFMTAAMKIVHSVLLAMSDGKGSDFLQARTRPIIEIFFKIAIVGGAIYFLFLAWDIDVTAWLASAGIIGLAIGFAAQDTLSNLFAGLFIVADAPYKLGDFIVLDGGIRGQVTRIGMRSTRILTQDHVEITVPNSVIAKSQIINEAGGPQVKQRSKVTVGVAYGADIDEVSAVLLKSVDGIAGILDSPSPEVRFVDFGESSLDFELLVWVASPDIREKALSDIRKRVYVLLREAGIEIPFPKRDLYIKELPK